MKVPKCIALTGYAGIGKDTCADWICEKYGHRKIAFADPLKDKVAHWIGDSLQIPPDVPSYIVDLADQCRLQWADGLVHHEDWGLLGFVRAKPYSPELRKLLQFAGTEYYRGKDAKYWIKSMHLDPDRKYVISDMRFPDECAFAKAIGALCLGIYRPGTASSDQHASETQINSLPVDYWIVNEFGNLDNTFNSLKHLLEGYYDASGRVVLTEVSDV